MDARTFRAIQLLALQAVEDPTYENFYDRVCRWYSQTYATPLREVSGMPDEEVLRVYFEETFREQYSSSDEHVAKQYDDMRVTLLYESDENEAAADEAWEEQMLKDLAEQSKGPSPKGKVPAPSAQEIAEALASAPNLIPDSSNVFVGGEEPEDQ